ncbi:MAG: chloride channel protein [Bacteroidetes bacterium]|nr:MAG: chloride channel protein [Bacteroidota bacterium]
MRKQRPLRYLRTHYLRQLRLLDRNFEWKITGRWMVYSALIGVFGALGALVFSVLVEWISDGTLLELVGYSMPMPGGESTDLSGFDLQQALHPTRRWLLFLVPSIGGLVSGWLVFKFAPEAEGHGTDAVIKAYHREGGEIRPRVAVIKMLASSITIGTGGSAGKEGPIAQIGATFGSYLGRRLNLNPRERRLLLIAGVAAGISSIFQSPLGGAFFAVEVLYREDIESEGIMPAMIAAITGYSVYSTIAGTSTVFTTPAYQFINPLELLPLIVFAVVCAVVGIAFTNAFYGTRNLFTNRLAIPTYLKPAIGGLLLGILAFFFPAVLGSSYGWLQQAINGNLPMTIMLIIVFAKIIGTSFTIGSGGSGGVFAPSLVIGGMLGGIYGLAMATLLPDLVTQPAAYVMIGMATFFAAVANVPIAMTIMISEMTGSYTLLVPLIFSGVIAHVLARRWSLYSEQVRSYNESPAHRHELAPELLSRIKVGSIIKHPVYYHSLVPDHTLDEIESVFTRTREVILPVTSAEEVAGEAPEYVGLVLLDSIQPYLDSDTEFKHTVIALDIAEPFVSVNLDSLLDEVQAVFERVEYPELPVLDASGLIVGFIRPGQVISAYHRASLRIKIAGNSGSTS